MPGCWGELTRREQELSVTFENMGDGVVMFDADLAHRFVESKLQELLDVANHSWPAAPALTTTSACWLSAVKLATVTRRRKSFAIGNAPLSLGRPSAHGRTDGRLRCATIPSRAAVQC